MSTRRSGSLRRSKDGTCFEVRVTYPGGKKSKWIQLPPELTERQADRARAFYAEQAKRGVQLLPEQPSPAATREATVGDLVALWVPLMNASDKLAPATKKGHEEHARGPIASRFGDKAVSELTTPLLRAWIRELKERRSASRTRNIFFSLAKMIEESIAEGWTPGPNPCRHAKVTEELPDLELPDDDQKARHTEREAAQLILATAAPERRLRYLVAYTSGMRDGEIAGLRWADATKEHDLEVLKVRSAIARIGPDGWATRKAPKTKSSRRTLPVHPLAAKALQAWRESGWEAFVGRPPTDEDPVFPSPDGTPCRPRSAELFRADLEAAGLPAEFEGEPFEFRSTRRSFATWLGAKGVSGDMVDRLLGHVPQTTRGRHYTASDLVAWAQAVALIDLPISDTTRTPDPESGEDLNGATSEKAPCSPHKTGQILESHQSSKPVWGTPRCPGQVRFLCASAEIPPRRRASCGVEVGGVRDCVRDFGALRGEIGRRLRRSDDGVAGLILEAKALAVEGVAALPAGEREAATLARLRRAAELAPARRGAG